MFANEVGHTAEVLADAGCENEEAWSELIRHAYRQNSEHRHGALQSILEAVEGTEVENLVIALFCKDVTSLVDAMVGYDLTDERVWLMLIREAKRKPGKAGELCIGYIIDKTRYTAAEDVILEIAERVFRDDGRRDRHYDGRDNRRDYDRGGRRNDDRRDQNRGRSRARSYGQAPAQGSWAARIQERRIEQGEERDHDDVVI